MAGSDDDRVVGRAQRRIPEPIARSTKAGYLSLMTIKAMCTTCNRTVYVDAGDTPVCPVCSSPLLETVESVESLDEEKLSEQGS